MSQPSGTQGQPGASTGSLGWYCHDCRASFPMPDRNGGNDMPLCPMCRGDFVEEKEADNLPDEDWETDDEDAQPQAQDLNPLAGFFNAFQPPPGIPRAARNANASAGPENGGVRTFTFGGNGANFGGSVTFGTGAAVGGLFGQQGQAAGGSGNRGAGGRGNNDNPFNIGGGNPFLNPPPMHGAPQAGAGNAGAGNAGNRGRGNQARMNRNANRQARNQRGTHWHDGYRNDGSYYQYEVYDHAEGEDGVPVDASEAAGGVRGAPMPGLGGGFGFGLGPGGPGVAGGAAGMEEIVASLMNALADPNGAGLMGGGGAGNPFAMAGNPGDYVFTDGRMDDLMDQLMGGHRGPPPAGTATIDALPRLTFDEASLEASQFKDCQICQDDYVVGDEVITLPCKHLYHTKCLVPWLEINSTCPSCRFSIATEADRNRPLPNPLAGAGGANGLPDILAGLFGGLAGAPPPAPAAATPAANANAPPTLGGNNPIQGFFAGIQEFFGGRGVAHPLEDGPALPGGFPGEGQARGRRDSMPGLEPIPTEGQGTSEGTGNGNGTPNNTNNPNTGNTTPNNRAPPAPAGAGGRRNGPAGATFFTVIRENQPASYDHIDQDEMDREDSDSEEEEEMPELVDIRGEGGGSAGGGVEERQRRPYGGYMREDEDDEMPELEDIPGAWTNGNNSRGYGNGNGNAQASGSSSSSNAVPRPLSPNISFAHPTNPLSFSPPAAAQTTLHTSGSGMPFSPPVGGNGSTTPFRVSPAPSRDGTPGPASGSGTGAGAYASAIPDDYRARMARREEEMRRESEGGGSDHMLDLD